MQAAQASDFAIGEFKGLWRLLFVHGRWNYMRISDLILYFFYKNMLFTVPQLFFAVISAWSAQTVFDEVFPFSSFFTYLFPRCLTCYNLFFTALPLMCRGIWDQDFHFEKIVRNQEGKFIIIPNTTIKQKIPLTYYRGQENQLFSIKLYAKWILEGVPFIFILLFYNLLDHCCIRLLLLLL